MLIRDRVLELLADGDMTAASIADELGALRNSVDKALVRAREEREIHICGYEPSTPRPAAIYRVGEGVDAERPTLVAPADQRPDADNARDAKARDVEMPVYFELEGGLLKGVRHFACDPYKATLSVKSCADRYEKANSDDPDVYSDRYSACRTCAYGAAHAGRVNPNLSKLKGMRICGRCHTGVARLIGKHLCISCYNRQREYLIGKNAKGTKPIKLAKLAPRSITYRAGGVVKTRKIAETVDTDELIVAVLRDEECAPQFAYRAPAALDWLLDDDVYDRSIGDTVEVADVAAVADSAQELAVVPIVASVLEDVVAPMPAALDVVLADPVAAVDVDPLPGAARCRRAACA
ncbi:hypothetical protein BZM27_09390 [Paraburkholderia steynii]|uniref:Uncharacterized protein n=1 Tax=Paraburkholderia steynii TaxID=1245441 RepID=A0A4R0XEY6_9BURK|nr:hypothetical protein BZM27_09390 [Paraburkholderia steynii]